MSLGRLSSPLSSVTLRLLHMHYNRGSQVMNICVRPAVKISLITQRLESKAVYTWLASRLQASAHNLLGMTPSHVVLCYGKAYLLYLSPVSLSLPPLSLSVAV